MESDEEIKWFENYDITNIITPVKVGELNKLLKESGYNRRKTRYLINGFRKGFKLQYRGERDVVRTSPNRPFSIGNKTILWNKVMTEVEAGRYAGPFTDPPFKHFIQSPIGLVPKDKGRKTRLIFHLSYPRDGRYESINQGIPNDFCSVKYPSFDRAIKLCMKVGQKGKIAKSDMERAFRNVPLFPGDFKIMLMKAEHPETGQIFWFLDKCLPFGSSISCKIFQDFSDAVAHIVSFKTGKDLVNYLDDYFFAAIMKLLCDNQVQTFLDVCRDIGFPVSMEKTVWGSDTLVFLGLLIDMINQVVCIPQDKVNKALTQIEYFLDRTHKKTTVERAQEICGLLNFLCKCVIPGRAFVTRLYSMQGKYGMKPHHHVRITEENRLDLTVWKIFLQHPKVYCRPFMDFAMLSADEVNMYSDASGNSVLGFSAICQNSFLWGKWDTTFINIHKPSIQYLELYALTAGVLTWVHRFKNRKIRLFVDNDAVKFMINSSSSKCKNCMILMRLITIECLINNVRLYAKHITSEDNGPSDALSRLDFDRFETLCPNRDKFETPVPRELIPMSKVWYQ